MVMNTAVGVMAAVETISSEYALYAYWLRTPSHS
jgi:hypothetical protein